VESEGSDREDGRSKVSGDDNVVPFPGDWIGSRDDLVPFGVFPIDAGKQGGANAAPNADGSEVPRSGRRLRRRPKLRSEFSHRRGPAPASRNPEPTSPRPPGGAAFWGEESAAVQDAMQGPLLAHRRRPEHRFSLAHAWKTSRLRNRLPIVSPPRALALLLVLALVVGGLVALIQRLSATPATDIASSHSHVAIGPADRHPARRPDVTIRANTERADRARAAGHPHANPSRDKPRPHRHGTPKATKKSTAPSEVVPVTYSIQSPRPATASGSSGGGSGSTSSTSGTSSGTPTPSSGDSSGSSNGSTGGSGSTGGGGGSHAGGGGSNAGGGGSDGAGSSSPTTTEPTTTRKSSGPKSPYSTFGPGS
jgi:hypothetical protein